MDKDFKNESVWLMQGDCLERMKEIPSGSVDAIISDIPYGIDYSDWDLALQAWPVQTLIENLSVLKWMINILMWQKNAY